jgi:hypothetical protein
MRGQQEARRPRRPGPAAASRLAICETAAALPSRLAFAIVGYFAMRSLVAPVQRRRAAAMVVEIVAG